MKISKLILAISLSFMFFGYSQNRLTGNVVDSNNKPVAKAKIYLDSIDSKVVTNKHGDYEVVLPAKVNIVTVHSDKYGSLSSNYINESTLNFIYLKSDQSTGNTGSTAYAETDQKYIISQSDDPNTSKDKRYYKNIYEMIRGKVAGVNVSNNNHITIRGASSLREFNPSSSNQLQYDGQPLFVVNGMVVPSIDHLTPNIVKSIEILKDTEASIYGSRGANGVIVNSNKN